MIKVLFLDLNPSRINRRHHSRVVPAANAVFLLGIVAAITDNQPSPKLRFSGEMSRRNGGCHDSGSSYHHEASSFANFGIERLWQHVDSSAALVQMSA